MVVVGLEEPVVAGVELGATGTGSLGIEFEAGALIIIVSSPKRTGSIEERL
jgi:hypothetical protein